MILAALILILLFFAFYIISPFYEKAYKRKTFLDPTGNREELIYKKEEILAAINDLEYDFKMHKMNEADYLQLKERYSAEAIEVMKKIDTLEGKTDEPAAIATGPIRAGRKVRS